MVKKYLDNRILTLFVFPFLIGSLTVLSFQPFNFTFINFIILPIFFYLLVYVKKNQKVLIEKTLQTKFIFTWYCIWFWILPKRNTLGYEFPNI